MHSVEKYIKFNMTFSNIEKELQKYKNSSLTEYGLRSTHLLCMVRLKDSGGMTPTELAESCSVNKALISRVTADLFERGYIEFTADSADKKYRKKMALSNEGERITEEIIQKITHAVSAVSGNISARKLAVFYDVLFTIEKNIENLSKK